MGVNVSTILKSIVQNRNSLLLLPFITAPFILVSLSHLLNTLWDKYLPYKSGKKILKSEYFNLFICLFNHSSSQQECYCIQGNERGVTRCQQHSSRLPTCDNHTNVFRYRQMSLGVTIAPGWGPLRKLELITLSSSKDTVPPQVLSGGSSSLSPALAV